MKKTLKYNHKGTCYTYGCVSQRKKGGEGLANRSLKALKLMADTKEKLTEKAAHRITVNIGSAMKDENYSRADEFVDKLSERLGITPEETAETLAEKTEQYIDVPSERPSHIEVGLGGLVMRKHGILIDAKSA